MRLHTREQAPKEGQQESPVSQEPYTPTRDDYLAFLVDSQHVYQALEDVVNAREELAAFRNTGLERVERLETDIAFLVNEYELERPSVGTAGIEYADMLRRIESIPEFMCHYYNHYFAHTAGGRMIGKKMSALLLDKKTLEFYKVRYRHVVLSSLTFGYIFSGMGTLMSSSRKSRIKSKLWLSDGRNPKNRNAWMLQQTPFPEGLDSIVI